MPLYRLVFLSHHLFTFAWRTCPLLSLDHSTHYPWIPWGGFIHNKDNISFTLIPFWMGPLSSLVSPVDTPWSSVSNLWISTSSFPALKDEVKSFLFEPSFSVDFNLRTHATLIWWRYDVCALLGTKYINWSFFDLWVIVERLTYAVGHFRSLMRSVKVKAHTLCFDFTQGWIKSTCFSHQQGR